MSRMTLVFSLLATVIAAGGVFYGTRLAEELRESNRRLALGQEETAASQRALAKNLAELRLMRSRRVSGPSVEPAARKETVRRGGGNPNTGINARLNALERGPGANNPMRNDLIARYRKLQEQAAAHGETNAELRVDALEAVAELAKWGDPEALDILTDALDDPQDQIREEAVDLLGELGSADLLPRLDQAAGDPSPEVRKAVAGSLQSMPIETAGPILVRLLDDVDPDVAQEAIETITGLGYAAARPKLAELLDHTDHGVVAEVGRAMRILGDDAAAQKAIERIGGALSDPNPRTRIRGIKDLRKIGGPNVVPLIRKAMTDSDETVRESAAKTLERLGYEE